MRALFFFILIAVIAAAPARAGAAQGAAGQEISESHLAATKALLLAADPGGVFERWSEANIASKLGEAVSDPAPGSFEHKLLNTALQLGGQGRAKLLEMHATMIAREMDEADILAVAALYADGKSEKAIMKTKAGRKWRDALLETGQLRQDAVTVVQASWINALNTAVTQGL